MVFSNSGIQNSGPKVDYIAPWRAVRLPRRALEVGPSQRVVRLFTIEVVFRPDIGNVLSLQALPSRYNLRTVR
jgi:hypothetical protein